MANALRTGCWVAGAVLASVLLLTGCSYGTSSSNSSQEPDCGGVLASAIQGVRADDTSGTTDSYFQWLTENCSYEYNILVDYTSTRGAASAALGSQPCSDLAQHLVPEAIDLLRADGLCTNASAPAAPEPVEQPGGGISWDAAVSYAGTEQRVCGPLVGDGYSEDDVFLNLGLDYPDPGRFQLVVWDIGALEPIAYGSTLCTSGVITLYNGVAQIELYDPSRISIYE